MDIRVCCGKDIAQQNLILQILSNTEQLELHQVLGEPVSSLWNQGTNLRSLAIYESKGGAEGRSEKTKIKSSNEGHLLVTSLVKQKPFPKLFSIKDGEGEGELKNPIGLCVLNNGTLVQGSLFFI